MTAEAVRPRRLNQALRILHGRPILKYAAVLKLELLRWSFPAHDSKIVPTVSPVEKAGQPLPQQGYLPSPALTLLAQDLRYYTRNLARKVR